MRVLRLAVSGMSLFCAACAGAAMQPTVVGLHYPAYGEPADYYPGLGPTGTFGADYTAWLARNKAAIAEVRSRLAQIKDGTQTPGCIGEDKYICVATFAQRMVIADDWRGDLNLFPEIKYDVNGKAVNGSTVMLYGFPPNGAGRSADEDVENVTQLMMTLSPSGSVSRITAILPEARDPLLAHTQEDYDRTHVYEVVATVTAKTCPTLTSSEVARWIENVIKPTVVHTKETSVDDGASSGRAESFYSRKTVFCGRTFSFNSSAGYYHEGFSRVPFEGTILNIE
jgi:hypothetical protein